MALGAVLAGCDPGLTGQSEGDYVRDALTAQPEELELWSPLRRAVLFDQLRRRCETDGKAQLLDGPALLAAQAGDHLVAFGLPSARELVAGVAVPVELDGSGEPWPAEPRAALGGASEREMAQLVASALAARLRLEGPLAVERAAGVPYAAAYVQGRLRLNPALLYLAAAAYSFEAGAPDATAVPDGRAASCTAAGAGGALPLAGLFALGALRRRSRRRSGA